MLQRNSLFIGLRLWLLLGVVGLFAESSRGDDGWLTQPERDLFSAFGTNANVDGKSLAATPRFTELPEIAKRMTPQQKAQAARQQAKQEQLATVALKYAQSQLAVRNFEEAKAAFNRVLDLAPDSSAAKTAKAALKNFEK